MSTPLPKPILIAGPTASGKSALALQLARERGGVIINADSMQVYRELRVLTARPSLAEEAQAPHALYGHVSAAEPYSVARWLTEVSRVLEAAAQAGETPIITGGTGLYFRALGEGLSPIPPIPDDIRRHWRSEAQRLGSTGLHEVLAARDATMAARLEPADAQRVTRALEVLDATGRSLADWQREPGTPLLNFTEAERLLVRPSREVLRARCDQRFDQMMAAGALGEVRALLALGLPPDAPAMRALGVPPLVRHLAGAMSLEAAIEQAKAETRQYLKRQETWIRRNMRAWTIAHSKD